MSSFVICALYIDMSTPDSLLFSCPGMGSIVLFTHCTGVFNPICVVDCLLRHQMQTTENYVYNRSLTFPCACAPEAIIFCLGAGVHQMPNVGVPGTWIGRAIACIASYSQGNARTILTLDSWHVCLLLTH